MVATCRRWSPLPLLYPFPPIYPTSHSKAAVDGEEGGLGGQVMNLSLRLLNLLLTLWRGEEHGPWAWQPQKVGVEGGTVPAWPWNMSVLLGGSVIPSNSPLSPEEEEGGTGCPHFSPAAPLFGSRCPFTWHLAESDNNNKTNFQQLQLHEKRAQCFLTQKHRELRCHPAISDTWKTLCSVPENVMCFFFFYVLF